MRARGMGARVVITEVKPTAALKAVLEGYEVMTMDDAAKVGDIFLTATGMKDILVERHFKSMKEGAIVSNTGHYDCEINLDHLKKLSKKVREVRPNNEEYTMEDGAQDLRLGSRSLSQFGGREGHPSEVMDMSFANQFLAMCRLAKEGKSMKPIVYDIDPAQDQDIGPHKAKAMDSASTR